MKADEAKRLKSLEVENQRLKKLVAEQALDIDMVKELAEETLDPGTQTPSCRPAPGAFRGFRASCVPPGWPAPFNPQPKPPPAPSPADERLAARLRPIAEEHPR
jgi:hypothetical protein